MNKLFVCRVNQYRFALLGVTTIALFVFFFMSWYSYPALWCRALSITLALALEDVAVFLISRHIAKYDGQNAEVCINAFSGLVWGYIFGYLALAFTVLIFALANIWLFIGTMVVGLILFLIGMGIMFVTYMKLSDA